MSLATARDTIKAVIAKEIPTLINIPKIKAALTDLTADTEIPLTEKNARQVREKAVEQITLLADLFYCFNEIDSLGKIYVDENGERQKIGHYLHHHLCATLSSQAETFPCLNALVASLKFNFYPPIESLPSFSTEETHQGFIRRFLQATQLAASTMREQSINIFQHKAAILFAEIIQAQHTQANIFTFLSKLVAPLTPNTLAEKKAKLAAVCHLLAEAKKHPETSLATIIANTTAIYPHWRSKGFHHEMDDICQAVIKREKLAAEKVAALEKLKQERLTRAPAGSAGTASSLGTTAVTTTVPTDDILGANNTRNPT